MREVVIAMTHSAKGKPKILKECTLPLTGKHVVDMIITELAVFQVTEQGLMLTEIHKNTDLDTVLNLTDAEVMIPKIIGTFGA